MPALFGGSAQRLRMKARQHLNSAESYVASGDAARALPENLLATRFTRRLAKVERDNLWHRAVLGSLYYNQALLLEKTGDPLRGITAARNSVLYYEWLDPTRNGSRSVAEAVEDSAPISDGGKSLDAAGLIAGLADARSRLGYLLGTHGAPDQHRARELVAFDLDPEWTLWHEVTQLDAKSYFAYKALVNCSRCTEDELNRILEQNNKALANSSERFYGA